MMSRNVRFSRSGDPISQLVKSLVNRVVKCGKEPGNVGGKVPVLLGKGSLRRIFFWKYFATRSADNET